MRICIISTGRAGSTSLYNLIKNHLDRGYYTITEPFNDKIKRIISIEPNQFEFITNKTNVLIKTITDQKPIDTTNEFIEEWIFSFFDKIILLDRSNIKEQAESFAYLIHTNNESWHVKQSYKMSLVPDEIISEWEDRLLSNKNLISTYSKKYNKKLYTYEDIFINKNIETLKEIFEYLAIDLKYDLVNEWIFSDEKKVRISENKNKLI